MIENRKNVLREAATLASIMTSRCTAEEVMMAQETVTKWAVIPAWRTAIPEEGIANY